MSDDAEDAGHTLAVTRGQPGVLGEGLDRQRRAGPGSAPCSAWLVGGVMGRLRVSPCLSLLIAISFSIVSDYDLHIKTYR